MSNIQVNFGDNLPETSKSSAFWDMGVDSHLKWLLLFSPDVAGESGRHQSTKPQVLVFISHRMWYLTVWGCKGGCVGGGGG